MERRFVRFLSLSESDITRAAWRYRRLCRAKDISHRELLRPPHRLRSCRGTRGAFTAAGVVLFQSCPTSVRVETSDFNTACSRRRGGARWKLVWGPCTVRCKMPPAFSKELKEARQLPPRTLQCLAGGCSRGAGWRQAPDQPEATGTGLAAGCQHPPSGGSHVWTTLHLL